MPIEFTLETVLAVVISLVTLNLLFIGFYIISVLRAVKKTVNRAGEVIEEVDKTVKDGIEKAHAMEKPMQALATTAAAFGGIIKGSDVIRKATNSILGVVNEVTEEEKPSTQVKKKGILRKPKFFKAKG